MRFIIILGFFFLNLFTCISANENRYHFFSENLSTKQLKNGLTYALVDSKEPKIELCIPYQSFSKKQALELKQYLQENLQNYFSVDSGLEFLVKDICIEATAESIIYSLNTLSLHENLLAKAMHLFSLLFELDALLVENELLDAYHAMYQPQNATLIIRGEGIEASAEDLIRQYFEPISNLLEAEQGKNEIYSNFPFAPNRGAAKAAANEDYSKNTNAESVEPFYKLAISETDKINVSKLIKKLADRNVIELLWHKKEMTRLGDKIEHLHPLRFIGYIYSRPDLIKCMKTISQNSFKWHAFVDGFAGGMDKEAKRNNLIAYLPGFCRETGAEENAIRNFISKHQWEELLRYYL
ncbi:MAG: hypothetical protein Tsb0015_10190 [Simkaniaceae bacterium]